MKEIIKGMYLFTLNWVLVILFYFLSILVFIGEVMQRILKTSTMPVISFFMDAVLIVIVSYFVNLRFIKAKNLTFIVSQVLFGMSVLAFLIMALQAVANGILMNA